MKAGRIFFFLALAAAALFAGGCGKENSSARKTAFRPRLLSESEVRSFFAAEKKLNLQGKTPGELRIICTLKKDDLEDRLTRFGFTIESFLETSELIFFARFGREIFVDLPRRKRALLKAVLNRLQGPENKDLREKLEKELNEPERDDREFITVILANAHVLGEYEKKYGTPPGAK